MIHTKYLGINWEPGFSGILSFQKFDAEMVSDTRWRQGLKDLNEEKGWSWRMRSNREYLLFWIEIEMWKLLVKSSSPSAEILAYTLQYENYFRVGSPLAVFIAAGDFLRVNSSHLWFNFTLSSTEQNAKVFNLSRVDQSGPYKWFKKLTLWIYYMWSQPSCG